MFRYAMIFIVGASLAGIPITSGCVVKHEKTVEVRPHSGVVTEEKTVTETPTGTIREKQTKTVDRP